jgi:hypothetical protein
MSKKFEEQDDNEKHDEIAGAQSVSDCAQTRLGRRTGEDRSSEGAADKS